jgi:protoheme IX farnesyltransferase
MAQNVVTSKVSISLLSDFKTITKMGLSLSVVFSCLAGYLLAADTINYSVLSLLAIGGYCMVGASNVFNQIIERDLDALMDRTKNRPLPMGRISVTKRIYPRDTAHNYWA